MAPANKQRSRFGLTALLRQAPCLQGLLVEQSRIGWTAVLDAAWPELAGWSTTAAKRARTKSERRPPPPLPPPPPPPIVWRGCPPQPESF